MELIFNRTFATLRNIRQLYLNARDSKSVLRSQSLEPYKEYFINNESLSRWSAAGIVLADNLKFLGFEYISVTNWIYYDNQVSQASVTGNVRHVAAGNEDGEGSKKDWTNYAQGIMKSCIDNIKNAYSINPSLYKSMWEASQLNEPELWGDLPESIESRWTTEAYAECLTITDINWLEASLYIANKLVDYIISVNEFNPYSGQLYSGEV